MSTRFPYSPVRTPPIPAVIVTLTAPGSSISISGVSAHLDSAADVTVIPLPLVQQLGLHPVGRVTGHGLGGVTQPMNVYRVSLEIAGLAVLTLRAPAHPLEPFVLIGRDILNLFRITFDGPNQMVEFH